jgi:small-conductance mechanosensitive channel
MPTRCALQVLLACIVVFAPSAFPATEPSDSSPAAINAAPVTLDGRTLFRLRGVSALPARERAANVRANIVEVAKDTSIAADSGRLEQRGERIVVRYGDHEVVTFLPSDAELEGVRLGALAEAALTRLGAAIESYRTDRSPEHLLRVSGILLVISLAAAAMFWAVLALFRWLSDLLERRVQRKIQKIEQASHRVLDAAQIGGWLRGLLRALRALALFTVVLVWLETALGLYPWTRPMAAELFKLVMGPLKEIGAGILNAVPDLVFLAILFAVIRFCLQAVRTFFERVDQGWIRLARFEPELAMPTYRIVRVLIIVFGLVIAYPYIPGSDSEAFKGMSIFFGVVLSIGSSSFIANIIAGYSLTYRRAFRVGDRIRVSEQEGIVLEMRTLNTRLRSLKNEEINIPNSLVLGSPIINYSSYQTDPGLILHTEVGIGYDVPWRQVEAMLLEAAARTNGLKTEPAPFVLQKSLGDFTVVYQLNAYCDRAEQMGRYYSVLHGHIQDVFNEYGVQIMSPNYEADPGQPKLVPPERWYTAPAKPPDT